jgi:hypothetical protein
MLRPSTSRESDLVREVGDSVANPVPRHSVIVIAGGRELVGARGALLKDPLAVTSTE